MKKIKWITDKCVKIDGDYFIRHSKQYAKVFLESSPEIQYREAPSIVQSLIETGIKYPNTTWRSEDIDEILSILKKQRITDETN